MKVSQTCLTTTKLTLLHMFYKDHRTSSSGQLYNYCPMFTGEGRVQIICPAEIHSQVTGASKQPSPPQHQELPGTSDLLS